MVLPSAYQPIAIEDFIGDARNVAHRLRRLLDMARPTGEPIKVLLLGAPGIGKTALANWLQVQLGADKWTTRKYNGTQVRLDEVEGIARSLQLRDLFGHYRFIRIEEVDQVPGPPRCAS